MRDWSLFEPDNVVEGVNMGYGNISEYHFE